MEKRRTYMKSDLAEEKLKSHFASMLENGNTLLPSECELSEIVGCSRVSLRRLLARMEQDGTLSKGPRGRSLSVVSKKGPKVVFTATGVGTIGNMTWSRVWHSLSLLAENADINLSLVITEMDREEETYAPIFSNPPDYLILADFTREAVKKKLLTLKGQSVIIALDEQHAPTCDYGICLDNFEAGRLAAQILLKAGYKKPCFLGLKHKQEYKPFLHRAEGFLAALKEVGIANPDAERWFQDTSKKTFQIQNVIAESKSIAESDFDSLFLYSDEEASFIYEVIEETRRIPSEFGLITMKGMGPAYANNYFVNSIDQAEKGIAAELLNVIQTLEDGGKIEESVKYIKPEALHGGKTIRS